MVPGRVWTWIVENADSFRNARKTFDESREGSG